MANRLNKTNTRRYVISQQLVFVDTTGSITITSSLITFVVLLELLIICIILLTVFIQDLKVCKNNIYHFNCKW